MKPKPVPGIVEKCVPRHDVGAFMVITRKGLSATSTTEIPEGSHAVMNDDGRRVIDLLKRVMK